jgi:predicted metal-dependent phosphoesterase TrpH
VSVTFANTTVHIVGLGIDPSNDELVAGIANVRAGRELRARQMGDGLARVGIQGAYEGAIALAPNPDLVSRTHFGRFLIASGVASDMHAVFRRYLTEGKPGYVEHRWAKLGEAVRWIRAAGGVAVIAHPGRYKFTPTEEYALFSEFQAHGGEAVEVVTGSHHAGDVVKYTEMAIEFGMLASRGSDFHDPEESRLDLGLVPGQLALSPRLTPVWSRWSQAELRSESVVS